jgi:hypothetical protein
VKRLGYIIILGTLLVSVPRYAAAFAQAEPPLFGLPTAPITGLGFGILLEVGIYYVIDSWFDARRRGLKLHWMLLVGIGAQLVIAPLIVAPALVAHLRANGSELAGVLTWSPALWAWAVVVAAAPALLLAAVAAASYLREPASRKPAQSQQKASTSERESARASIEPAESEYECPHCPRTFSTVQALNAHQRFCAGTNGHEPAREEIANDH